MGKKLQHSALKVMNVHLISLGCPRNLVDSELMIGRIADKGYEITPYLDDADFIIINTCGFLEVAREESVETIRNVITEKKSDAKIIVTGCMAQLKTKELEELKPHIHYILGSGDVDKILSALASSESGSYITENRSYLEARDDPRLLSTPPHYAYVKIAEGCRKRCSYCIIPVIKGPLKSKSAEQILEEINSLLDNGVWELILIAQDLGDWGKDLGFSGSKGLTHLLRQILTIDRDFRLRLLYVYPDEIDDDLIALMKNEKRVLPYLDMPIQHINDDILKKMKRSTSKKQILTIVESLRKEIPDVSLRTSLMVGFPGETDEQFQELINFVKTAQFTNIGIFAYSNEDLCHSSSFADQIPEEVKIERCQILQDAQKKLIVEENKKFIGKTVPVLIDGYHAETELLMTGRLSGQCPEIDSGVIINDHDLVEAFGETYSVEITDVSDYDFVGKVISPCTRDEWI